MGEGIDPKYKSEFTPEAFESLNRRIAEFNQACDDRFHFSRPEFLKRYVRQRLHIHLHVRLRFDEGDAEDLCAIFGGPLGGGRREGSQSGFFGEPSSSSIVLHADEHQLRCRHYRKLNDQEVVLIGNIHFLKDGERVPAGVWFPIRLRRLNKCAERDGKALYCSTSEGFLKFLFLNTDGEMMLAKSVPPADLGTDQVVQTGSQIVQDFSGDHGETQGNVIQPIIERCNYVFPFSLHLSDDSVAISVRSEEPVKFTYQANDLLIGPLNLDIRGDVA